MNNNEEIKVEDAGDIFDYGATVSNALGCSAADFSKIYHKYRKAEAEFKKLYEPFKKNLLDLYKTTPELPNKIMVGDVKLTYVSPSTRSTIDSKKLKEEVPEIAKKFTKTTNIDATLRIEGI